MIKAKSDKFFKNLLWDLKLSPSEIQILLDKNEENNPLTALLYVRILSSVAWYNILEQLNENQLRFALSDEVIGRIKSKSLKDRFRYARKMLFEKE